MAVRLAWCFFGVVAAMFLVAALASQWLAAGMFAASLAFLWRGFATTGGA